MSEWWRAASFELPIFPLPNVVHFPGVAVPLHVFEPRYRLLIRDALASDKRMALALLQPGYESDYYGAPAVCPLTCAGEIVTHQELADGRYYIVVMGFSRIKLDEQVQTAPYRKFRASPVAELPANEAAAPRQIQTFFACVQQLSQKVPEVAKALKELSLAKDDIGKLADLGASLFGNDAARRYGLLDTLDPNLRLERVTDVVSEFILQTNKTQSVLN